MRTERRRDGQQWVLDWLVKKTGRVQNFANDERDLPPEVKSYRMIPRVLYKKARHEEEIARAAAQAGHSRTALALFWRAAQTYRDAQHAIFEDEHPEKMFLHGKLLECYDEVIALAPYPIEKVEVPWEGHSIAALFHRVPGHERLPAVLFIPGMDMTKETYPNPLDNAFGQRAMHVMAMDGPGQGVSNIRKIWVTDDNYERAAQACLDYLVRRPEVDPARVGVCGTSFGSHWGPRLAARDNRVRALATTHAVYGPKRAIFEEASPRFKQMFMYMAGIRDEDAFDAMAARMTTEGYGSRITCPTLVVTGEYDPLCHLEDAQRFFDELAGPKEMWVFENEFHRVTGRSGIGGLDIYPFLADWLRDALDGRLPPDLRRMVLVPQKTGAGPYSPSVRSFQIPLRDAGPVGR
ncbi:MAG: alpha/beta fold hydrolase [Armatimonadota bacterium]|nr:alpha/beta fold hydrolase [Armatimonadota bacterium]